MITSVSLPSYYPAYRANSVSDEVETILRAIRNALPSRELHYDIQHHETILILESQGYIVGKHDVVEVDLRPHPECSTVTKDLPQDVLISWGTLSVSSGR